MSVGRQQNIEVKQLTSVAGGIGQAIDVLDMSSMTIQLIATGTGSVQFEGSIDGVNFFPVGAVVTAAGAFNVPFNRLAKLRAKTTVDVAGGGVYSAAVAGTGRGE